MPVSSAPAGATCHRLDGKIGSIEWGGSDWLVVLAAVATRALEFDDRFWVINLSTGQRDALLTTDQRISGPTISSTGEVFWFQEGPDKVGGVWHASSGQAATMLFEQHDVIGVWSTSVGLVYEWIGSDRSDHFDLRRPDGSVETLLAGEWDHEGAIVSRDGSMIVIQRRDPATGDALLRLYRDGASRDLSRVPGLTLLQEFAEDLESVVVLKVTSDSWSFDGLVKVPVNGDDPVPVHLPTDVGEVGVLDISEEGLAAWTELLNPRETLCIMPAARLGI